MQILGDVALELRQGAHYWVSAQCMTSMRDVPSIILPEEAHSMTRERDAPEPVRQEATLDMCTGQLRPGELQRQETFLGQLQTGEQGCYPRSTCIAMSMENETTLPRNFLHCQA